MATYVVNMATSELQVQQVIEQIWQVVARQVTRASPELVLPSNVKNVICQFGIDLISQRYR